MKHARKRDPRDVSGFRGAQAGHGAAMWLWLAGWLVLVTGSPLALAAVVHGGAARVVWDRIGVTAPVLISTAGFAFSRGPMTAAPALALDPRLANPPPLELT